MDAMILSAGLGMRMRPLTATTPKPLLKAGKHRLIEYHLRRLRQAGIQRVVINTSFHADKFPDTLGDGNRFGLQIQYVEEGDVPLETGGGIKHALPRLASDPFLVVNADIWTDFPFYLLVNREHTQSAHLVLVPNPAHNQSGDFFLKDGRVSSKDQMNSSQTFTFSGISVLSKQLFSNCSKSKFSLTEVFAEPILKNEITAECYDGHWFDIGTPQRLKDLRRWLKNHASI